MPVWLNFFRYFRRRIIFGLILVLLFTLCVLSLLHNEKSGLTFGSDFDDMDSMIINENSDDIFNDDVGDEVVKTFNKPLLWQMEVMSDIGNVNSAEFPSIESYSDNNTSIKPCRNSVQGKYLIVDDKGYVCTRHEVLSNGCCSTEIVRNTETILTSVPSLIRTRYTCETCNSQGCCEIYEYCVSCCLDPNKVKKKKNLNFDKIRKENLKSRHGEDILKLRLRNLDRFQLCLAACRTSSSSVQHENTYKNPLLKHCYILQLPSNHLNQRHKRNAISFDNNNDLEIAFSSSSAVKLLNLPPLLLKYPIFYNKIDDCKQNELLDTEFCRRPHTTY